jgi:hypothetical protein
MSRGERPALAPQHGAENYQQPAYRSDPHAQKQTRRQRSPMNSAPLVTHAALVARSIGWLREFKHCRIVLSEMSCGWIEVPDAIGFHERTGSVLIECKCSRSDFRVDGQKKARRDGVGMGAYRYYLVPHGLVRAHEFDALLGADETGTRFKWGSGGWGLLWWDPQTEKISMQRTSQRFKPNKSAETDFLVAALHRVQLRLSEPLHEYIRWSSAPAPQRRNQKRKEIAMEAHA